MPTAICPECETDVYVDADSEQGEVKICEECGASLVLVGLDPFELDVHDEADVLYKDDYGKEDAFDDYDNDSF